MKRTWIFFLSSSKKECMVEEHCSSQVKIWYMHWPEAIQMFLTRPFHGDSVKVNWESFKWWK
jgi:hypothetical protein